MNTIAAATDTSDVAAGFQRARVPRWFVVALLALLAFGVRAWDIEERSLSHPEAYVPGIFYPPGAHNPIYRSDVKAMLSGTIRSDNHPPGYYAVMMAVNQLLGVQLWALRMPSAVFGTMTVVLLLIFGWRRETPWVAGLAAVWLAVHGHHAHWSGQARMWAMLTFLTLLSVVLLHALRRRYRPVTAAAYVVTLTLGLWTDYYFWPFFVVHVAYELAARVREPRFPRSIVLHVIALVLASPVLAFLLVHRRRGEYLGQNLSDYALGWLGFNDWFEPDAISFGLSVIVALAGASLIAIGVRTPPADREVIERHASNSLSAVWMWLALAVPVLFIVFVGDLFPRRSSRFLWFVVPAGLVMCGSLAVRLWPQLHRPLIWLVDRLRVRHLLSDVHVAHGVAAPGLVFLLSLAVPCLAARGLMCFLPFQLVLAARGLNRLRARPQLRILAPAGVVFFGAITLVQYRTMPDARNYKEVASRIVEQRAPGDALLLEDAWHSQPILFYLSPRDMVVHFVEQLQEQTPAARMATLAQTERIWVVVVAEQADDYERSQATLLSGFEAEPEIKVEVPGMRARRYIRR